jgi:hypothetical protein
MDGSPLRTVQHTQANSQSHCDGTSQSGRDSPSMEKGLEQEAVVAHSTVELADSHWAGEYPLQRARAARAPCLVQRVLNCAGRKRDEHVLSI